MAAAANEVVGAPPRVARWLGLLRKWLSNDWALPLVVGALALAVALFRLGAPSLWMDEALSVEQARQPFDILWASFTSGYSSYMFSYFLLLDGWLRLTGALGLASSEFIIRLPSAVFGALASVMIFLLGRRFANREVGLAAALVSLLNPWQLAYAQEARSYSMLLFFTVASWYALLAALDGAGEGKRKRHWIWYVVATVLATYAQLLNGLIILAQGAAFAALFVLPTVWLARIRAQWLPLALSWGSIAVLIAPLVYVSRNAGWHTAWSPVLSLSDIVQRISQKYLGGASHARLALLLGGGLICALLVAAVVLWRAGPHLRRKPPASHEPLRQRLSGMWLGIVAILCWFLVPLLLSWAVSQIGVAHIFTGRYLIAIEPALCLLFGVALILFRSRVAYTLLLVGALAAIGLSLPQYYAHAQVEDWRTATRWVEARYRPGDGLVSFNNVQGVEVAVEAYLHTDHSAAHYTADSPGVISWANLRIGAPFEHAYAALRADELDRFAHNHPHIFFITGRLSGAVEAWRIQQLVQWLSTRYRLIGQTSSQGVTVYQFATSGSSGSVP